MAVNLYMISNSCRYTSFLTRNGLDSSNAGPVLIATPVLGPEPRLRKNRVFKTDRWLNQSICEYLRIFVDSMRRSSRGFLLIDRPGTGTGL
jgi:hypothetical protein